jgi:hypothetical protein
MNFDDIKINFSIRTIRFISNDSSFDVICILIFVFSHNEKIIFRQEMSRIIFSSSRIFIFIKNFACRLSTTWICRFSFAILLNSEMKSFKYTYSKQLCVAISMSRTATELSTWWINISDKTFINKLYRSKTWCIRSSHTICSVIHSWKFEQRMWQSVMIEMLNLWTFQILLTK